MLGSIDPANENSKLSGRKIRIRPLNWKKKKKKKKKKKTGWSKVAFIFRLEIPKFLRFEFEICFAGFWLWIFWEKVKI